MRVAPVLFAVALAVSACGSPGGRTAPSSAAPSTGSTSEVSPLSTSAAPATTLSTICPEVKAALPHVEFFPTKDAQFDTTIAALEQLQSGADATAQNALQALIGDLTNAKEALHANVPLPRVQVSQDYDHALQKIGRACKGAGSKVFN